MEQIRISAKNLGELALPNFCPRCFWIKLHCSHKLPYQIFPGIFSSIDSYTKKITNMHYQQHERVPDWFGGFGSLGKPIKVPHYSKFYVTDPESNILLTGAPDEILSQTDGSYFIVDYKTAKFTGTQDKLLPMYEVQLNAYAYIGERVGFKPISGLGLIYYEPVTGISVDELDSFLLDDGFSMHFRGKLLPIDPKPNIIPGFLKRVREIYELPQMPDGVEGCKDCELMLGMPYPDPLISLITLGREERFLEYKESAPWDTLKQKIAKTAMGMANIRNGGTIVIGIPKRGSGYVQEGMSQEHAATYDLDDIKAYVNRFADPCVRMQLHERKLNGKAFLVIVVQEFDELPIVCKRDCPPFMRQGAIYTRSYRMPETCEVRSQSEMREIIEMGVEKGVRAFIKMAQRVGVPLDQIQQKSQELSTIFRDG